MIVLVLCGLLPGIALAGIGAWTLKGEPWLTTRVLDFSIGYSQGSQIPSIYATAFEISRTLLYTDDEASNWTKMNLPLAVGSPRCVATNPNNPLSVFVGTLNNGIWYSTNGGGNWDPRNTGLTNNRPLRLVISPQNPNVVYCGTDFPDSPKQGDSFQSISVNPHGEDTSATIQATGDLFITTDGGFNWSNVSPHSCFQVWDIKVDPNDLQRVWVSGAVRNIGEHIIYLSTDGGAHWQSKDFGIDYFCVSTLALHPTDPNVLYALNYDPDRQTLGAGVYKTIDGGANWVKLNTDIKRGTERGLVLDPSSPNCIFAVDYNDINDPLTGRIYRSLNGGATWEKKGKALSEPGASPWPLIHPTSITLKECSIWGPGRRFIRAPTMATFGSSQMRGSSIQILQL